MHQMLDEATEGERPRLSILSTSACPQPECEMYGMCPRQIHMLKP